MNRQIPYSLLLLATPLTAFCGGDKKEGAKKPNILWIITDDQRADALACWNRATTGKSESALGYVSSPNIDKLAEEGTLFVNSFCNSPVSAPSRASMHTGRYPHHSGIYAFELAHNTNDYAKPLTPQVMMEAGYQTTLFGKLGTRIYKFNTPMRFQEDPENPLYHQKVAMEDDIERKYLSDYTHITLFGKDQIPGTIHAWNFADGRQEKYYVKVNNGEVSQEDIDKKMAIRKELDMVIMPTNPGQEIISGVSPMPTEGTRDGMIAKEFISYFDHENESYNITCGRKINGVNPDKPQFINLGFHFPHTPVLPSEEYREKFMDKTYKVPEVSDEEIAKIPKQLVNSWLKTHDMRSLSDRDKQQMIRDYYAFCAMGDKLLGETVDRFKRYCDEHDQPYVIILACGDHGWHLGEQGVTYKASNFIKSNQTAVIAVSSDKSLFPAGKVVTDILEYVDFAPTFFEMAGYDTSDERFSYLDGRDLVPIAHGDGERRDYTIGATTVSGGHRSYLRGHEFAFSMRTRPNKKLGLNEDVKWALNCSAEDAEMALYDLRVDPLERNNVAYDKEYAKLAEWFRKKLGTIVLGDNRVECDWNKQNVYEISSFAVGADDKKLDIPKKIVPKVK